jgi:hypothetical protein
MPMMPRIWGEKDQKLTGRSRQRQGVERLSLFRSRPVMITQVEEVYTVTDVTYGPNNVGYTKIRWRDATWADFAIIGKAPSGEEDAA